MFIPNHVHTQFSLLDGYVDISKLAKRCTEYNYPACIITDHGNMSGCVDFIETLNKSSVKPIIGQEFYICDDSDAKNSNNRSLSHMVICAKNKQGFNKLCELTSRANSDKNFYYKPRIDWRDLEEIADDNLIGFGGHPGSQLFDLVYKDDKLSPDADKLGEVYLNRVNNIFGKENFIIEIQKICIPHLDKILTPYLKSLCNKTGNKYAACIDAHYVDRADAIDQRIMLSSSINTTISKWKSSKIGNLSSFFNYDHFHLPSPDEIQQYHTTDELHVHTDIFDMCESYSIYNKPTLPKFECPNNMTEDQFLRKLCEIGWRDYLEIPNVFRNNKQEYEYRLEKELNIINNAGLSGYFLIVRDFIQFAKNKGVLCAIGRGSVGGSLVAYLTGITLIDPIPNNLIFSRFYNAGRNTETNIEFPDIDVDFPISIREEVINYIKSKYGPNHVKQICTVGTLQGAGILKEVLRIHEAVSFTEMNNITSMIPDKTKVEDKMKDTNEKSLLMYCLKHMPIILENIARYKDGQIVGPMAKFVEQAIRMEGVIKNFGVHAAGLIITPLNLNSTIPSVRVNNKIVAGLDMDSLKKMGIIKFDALGLNTFDKLMLVNNTLKG